MGRSSSIGFKISEELTLDINTWHESRPIRDSDFKKRANGLYDWFSFLKAEETPDVLVLNGIYSQPAEGYYFQPFLFLSVLELCVFPKDDHWCP